jgi:gluconolactonase
MRTTLASGTVRTVLVLALVIAGARCAGSGSGGAGTGGTGAGGPAGAAAGPGGSGAGTGAAGHNGTAGSGNSTGAAGQNGTAGTTGSGIAGQSAGTTGTGVAGGTGSGFKPYVCPTGITSPTSFPAGSTAIQIAGAPPSDSFNDSGNAFETIEGPVWITDALYVSEFGTTEPPPSRILKIDESDHVTIAFPSIADTGSNGLAVDGNGNIVSANHGVGGIVRFTLPSGTMTTLTNSFGGVRFNSPNDLTIRSDGTIYFTDPAGYQGNLVQPNQGVYMLPPGSSTAMELISTLNSPNGITLSLDEKTLFVDDNGDGLMKYAVNANGTIGATGTPFDTDLAHTAGDGMVMDCAGDLYVVRSDEHHIIVVNPSGTTIGDISGFPNSAQVSNVAFGGADHETLYITAQGEGIQRGVFKMKLTVPGMPY